MPAHEVFVGTILKAENIFHQLTEEEEEKRRLRRERNKVAASKCRERKKLKMERLSQVMYDTALISFYNVKFYFFMLTT